MLRFSLALPAAWKKWFQDAGDRWIGYRERRHRRQSEGIPSPQALDEAVAYYAGLYHDKRPDPAAFRRLLRRRGTPDWPNPYSVSDPEYFDLHPDGFLWADVECMARSVCPSGGQEDTDAQDIANAQLCWLMVLEETNGRWPVSLREVHPDNLAAITLEAMLHPDREKWGLSASKWTQLDILR